MSVFTSGTELGGQTNFYQDLAEKRDPGPLDFRSLRSSVEAACLGRGLETGLAVRVRTGAAGASVGGPGYPRLPLFLPLLHHRSSGRQAERWTPVGAVRWHFQKGERESMVTILS